MISRRTWRTLLAAGGLLIIIGSRSLGPFSDIRLLTEDTNGDGRPDVWRYYDGRGTLLRVAIDTNFDGRSDVDESFEQGRLVARRQDRNFDDRVDKLDTFDPTTGSLVASIIDVDFDGRADEEEFFDGGRAVATRWAPTRETSRRPELTKVDGGRAADESLQQFDDPFARDTGIGAAAPRPERLSAEAVRLAPPLTAFSESPRPAPARGVAVLSNPYVAPSHRTSSGPRAPPIHRSAHLITR